MTVTASLVGSQTPPLVQIVVSVAPDGEAWTVTGSTGAFTWSVPGGEGVGEGMQVVLADNLTPPNTPVTYTFTSDSVTEVSNSVTVPQDEDLTLQTLDGQKSVGVDLMDGSLDTELPTNMATFRVPGRARPVLRYDVVGDIVSQFVVRVPTAEATALREVLSSGAPIIYRAAGALEDVPPVGVVAIMRAQSGLYFTNGFREWTLGFVAVDNPFADVRLGAFSWEGAFDAAFDTLDWGDFNAAFATLKWDQFDTYDWGVLL